MKSTVFWDMMSYNPIEVCWRFGGTLCLQLYGEDVSSAWQKAARLKMDAVGSSETSANLNHIHGVISQKIVFIQTARKTLTRTSKFYRVLHSYQRTLSSPTGCPQSDQRRIQVKLNVLVSLLQNVSFWGMIKGRHAWHPAMSVTKPKHLTSPLVLCCQ
jgi:hypothetical protein